jgi:hypothetical protein
LQGLVLIQEAFLVAKELEKDWQPVDAGTLVNWHLSLVETYECLEDLDRCEAELREAERLLNSLRGKASG